MYRFFYKPSFFSLSLQLVVPWLLTRVCHLSVRLKEVATPYWLIGPPLRCFLFVTERAASHTLQKCTIGVPVRWKLTLYGGERKPKRKMEYNGWILFA